MLLIIKILMYLLTFSFHVPTKKTLYEYSTHLKTI